jgi:hypothetical protein
MSTMTVPRRAGTQRPGRARRGFVVAVVVVVAAVGIVGIRLAARSGGATTVEPQIPHYAPIPADPAIEGAWGIRFVAVILGGDRGLLDVRYQVTDLAKSARIHGGSASSDPQAAVKNLPTFIREADGRKILPASAMMHFEHQHYQTEKLGTAFSMIYGNAGGVLHTGDKVTIRMADGLELRHVVVSS